MFEAVDLVLDNHSQLFTQLADLVLAHQRLKDWLNLLGNNREVQEADHSGLTDTKKGLKGTVVRHTIKLSAVVKSYANSVKDRELWKMANYTRSELLLASDAHLFDIGTVLLKLALPIQAGLNNYLFGSEKITAYQVLLNGYHAAIPQKRVASSVSKVSTMNIGELIDSLSKLLKEEIDVLMLILEDSQPDFYRTYKSSRIIVNYRGGGKSKPEEGGTPPEE